MNQNPYEVDSGKKIRGQKSRATVSFRQVCGSTETEDSKNILGNFFKHPELRKRDWKVAELAGYCKDVA